LACKTQYFESTFSRCTQCAHLHNVPSIWFMNWPDDGSMSRNMLPDL